MSKRSCLRTTWYPIPVVIERDEWEGFREYSGACEPLGITWMYRLKIRVGKRRFETLANSRAACVEILEQKVQRLMGRSVRSDLEKGAPKS